MPKLNASTVTSNDGGNILTGELDALDLYFASIDLDFARRPGGRNARPDLTRVDRRHCWTVAKNELYPFSLFLFGALP